MNIAHALLKSKSNLFNFFFLPPQSLRIFTIQVAISIYPF